MARLRPEILGSYGQTEALQNEFVALPTEGDSGFEEFFEYKAGLVREAKRLFAPPEQTSLILRYPNPDNPTSEGRKDFDLFFDSPSIVARNQLFEGTFAIDITDHIGKEDREPFVDLMTFILDSPQTVFLLFARCERDQSISNMHTAISRYVRFTFRRLPLPGAQEIADYVMAGVRDFSLHTDPRVPSLLEEHFAKESLGYDAADHIVDYLRATDYDGSATGLEELLLAAERDGNFGKSRHSFGY